MGGMALEGSVLASFLDEAPPFNFELLPPEPDLENFPVFVSFMLFFFEVSIKGVGEGYSFHCSFNLL